MKQQSTTRNKPANRVRTLVQAISAGLMLACAPGYAASIDEAIQAYDNGDHEQSYQLFYTLSRLGNPVAAKQLAYMASEGEGREQNPSHTYAFLKAAQAWGDPGVAPVLEQLETQLSQTQLDEAKQFYQQIKTQLYIKELEATPLESAFNLNEDVSVRAIKRVGPDYPERSARQRAHGWSYQILFINASGDVVTTESYGSRFGNFSRATEKALRGWKYDTNQPAMSKSYFSFAGHEKKAKVEANFFNAIQSDLWGPALQGAPAHQRMLAEMLHQIANSQALSVTPIDAEVSGAPKVADFQPDELKLKRKLPASTFTLDASFNVSDIDIYRAKEMSAEEVADAIEQIENYDFSQLSGVRDIRYRVMADSRNRLTQFEVERPRVWMSEFWWQQAAQNGDREAQRKLALTDAQWMHYLLDQNDEFAQTWLGATLVTRGKSDTERTRGEALLRQAADNGSAKADAILKAI